MPKLLRHTLAFTFLSFGTSACADRPLVDVTTDAPTSATADAPGDPTSSGPSPTTALPDPTAAPGSTSGGDSSGVEDSSVETSAGFVHPEDVLTPPPDCDPWVQDCPDGLKCAPVSLDGDGSWERVKCVPVVAEPDDLGEPCEVLGTGVDGLDSCAEGQMCWNYDFETKLGGTCHAQCQGSPDVPVCQPDSSCSISGQGVLNLCLQHCDPLAQDCPGDDLCLFSPYDPEAFICVVDSSGDAGQTFDPCEYLNACDPGLPCLNPEAAVECDPTQNGCCLPFCDLTAPLACPGAGQACLPWYEEGQTPAKYAKVGVCALPR